VRSQSASILPPSQNGKTSNIAHFWLCPKLALMPDRFTRQAVACGFTLRLRNSFHRTAVQSQFASDPLQGFDAEGDVLVVHAQGDGVDDVVREWQPR